MVRRHVKTKQIVPLKLRTYNCDGQLRSNTDGDGKQAQAKAQVKAKAKTKTDAQEIGNTMMEADTAVLRPRPRVGSKHRMRVRQDRVDSTTSLYSAD